MIEGVVGIITAGEKVNVRIVCSRGDKDPIDFVGDFEFDDDGTVIINGECPE